MDQPPRTTEHTETAEERTARLAREGEAIESARRSLKERGGIPIEEIEAWVESWDTPANSRCRNRGSSSLAAGHHFGRGG
jgi:hypothetical protein